LLSQQQNDTGNAERLLLYGEGDYRWVAAKRRWVMWDGRRWPVNDDEHEYVRAAAQTMVRRFITQAANALEKATKENEKFCAQNRKFASGSRNTKALSNMLREAQPHATLTIEDMDNVEHTRYLLNFKNGTYDAVTGELREHCRENYITTLIPHDYNPEAQCPRFKRFLTETFQQNQELIDFFQRVIGYSATADTSEKYFFIWHGPKDAAKTTMQQIFVKALGDKAGGYADQIKVESLMTKFMDNNVSDDLSSLRGRRFVTTSETGENQQLNEAQLKRIVQGQGTYKCRELYEKSISFPETWHVHMDGNHLPRVNGTGDDIWERIITLPFTNVVPKDKQVTNFAEDLLAEEVEGILAWVVEGVRTWKTKGLQPPPLIEELRKGWRTRADDLGQWMLACCVVSSKTKVRSSALYASRKQWRTDNGYAWPETIEKFTAHMEAKGFVKKKEGKDKVPRWLGIGLNDEEARRWVGLGG
jgi:putative DNA primase/helicase